ncbi:phosphatase PAP2 family protein [Alloalcanivorax gelatiniphagus]|nr:phosphatase PAP2 family protein [Alloalcanivorax gelatiniphagus]
MMIQRPSLQRMTAADARAMGWLLRQPRAAHRAQLARGISRLGDGPLYVFLALVIWLLDSTQGTRFAQAAVIAYGLEVPAFMLLKHLIKRPRPADMDTTLCVFLKPADRFSFPSGHTAAAFVMATLMGVFYPVCATVMLAFAGLVGLSRVLLGVHYPSDIAAGALLGSLCAMTAMLLVG